MKIFELKLDLDLKQKTTNCFIGCDKKKFDAEDLTTIEELVQKFAQIVTIAYLHQAVEFEFITEQKEGEA